eukprot:10889232-Ditylum_brightwellii.AAC.1
MEYKYREIIKHSARRTYDDNERKRKGNVPGGHRPSSKKAAHSTSFTWEDMPSGDDSHTSTNDTNEDDSSFTLSEGIGGDDSEGTPSILQQYYSPDHAKVKQLVDA